MYINESLCIPDKGVAPCIICCRVFFVLFFFFSFLLLDLCCSRPLLLFIMIEVYSSCSCMDPSLVYIYSLLHVTAHDTCAIIKFCVVGPSFFFFQRVRSAARYFSRA